MFCRSSTTTLAFRMTSWALRSSISNLWSSAGQPAMTHTSFSSASALFHFNLIFLHFFYSASHHYSYFFLQAQFCLCRLFYNVIKGLVFFTVSELSDYTTGFPFGKCTFICKEWKKNNSTQYFFFIKHALQYAFHWLKLSMPTL